MCVYCYCYELTALFRHDSEVQTRELEPSDCVGKLYSSISKAKLIARLFFLFSISPLSPIKCALFFTEVSFFAVLLWLLCAHVASS